MNQQHLIDRAIFNTTYLGSAVAAEQRHEIDDFLRRQVLPVIEEVFDQQTEDPNRVFRIERLEIDLGEITLEDFRQQMPSRLRERLQAALREQQHRARTRASLTSNLTDVRGSVLQELLFYLQHGFLPWFSRPQDEVAIEARFDEILQQPMQELIDFFATHQHQPQILARLRNQFPSAVQKRIDRLLAASPEQRTYTADRSVETQAIPMSPLLQRLAPGSRLQVEPAIAQLLAAILSGDSDTIESRWPGLIAGQPEILARVLRRWGRQAILRRSIAVGFEAPLFEQLLQLLEPVEVEFLQTLMKTVSTVLQAELQLPSVRISEELREFTLHYLFDERSGSFKRRDYVISMLRQLAALYPLGQDRLTSMVAEQFRSRGNSDSVARELERLLQQLTAQSLPQLSENASTVQQPQQNLPDPLARVERLKRLMTIGKEQQRQAISSLFDDLRALRRAAPDLLVTLLSELRNADQVWRRLFEQLSLGELAELAVALLIRQPVDTRGFDDGVELERSFYRYLAQTRDKRQYILRFLEQWLKNEPIDFELLSIALRPASPPVAPIPAAEAGHGRPEIAEIPASEGDEDDELIEDIYIGNAGAVLVAPYLPHLFERLGYLEKGRFRNRDLAEHAVHCVQYLVNERLSSPEFELVLNKILCGVKPGLPIRRGIELDASALEQLDALLKSVIQHWQALGNTTVEGLREAFLQRNGRLQRKRNDWHLSVEAKPYDMLLEQIPWTYSIIKFPWMEQVLYVEWR